MYSFLNFKYEYHLFNFNINIHRRKKKQREERSTTKFIKLVGTNIYIPSWLKLGYVLRIKRIKELWQKTVVCLVSTPPPSPHIMGATHIIPSCKWSYHEMVHIWRDRKIHTDNREKGRDNKRRIQSRNAYIEKLQWN